METRPGTQGVPETVTKGRLLPTSASPSVCQGGGLLRHRVCDRLGAAEVVAERQVDHAVGLGGAGAKNVEIGESPAEWRGAGCFCRRRRRIGAGEREDGVTVAQEFGDDRGPDETGAAGDENAHDNRSSGYVSD